MLDVDQVPSANHPLGQNNLEFLWIELTNRCNLECVHCYCDSGPKVVDPEPLSFEQFTWIIDSAKALGCKRIQFIGGEPTLSKELASLIAHAHSRDIAVEIFTNATRLSAGFLAHCVEHRVAIATSFYCDDALIHDSITKRKGSHRRTVENIRTIVEAGLELRVGIIAMAQNKHRLRHTETFLRELGVTQIGFDNVRGVGRAGPSGAPADDTIDQLCGHCGSGRVAITPDGAVYPCVMSRQWNLGALPRDALDDIMASGKLTTFRNALAHQMAARVPAAAHCVPNDESIPGGPRPPCFPEEACYPDSPCAPKNPCWPEQGPCTPDQEPWCLPKHGPPPCTPQD